MGFLSRLFAKHTVEPKEEKYISSSPTEENHEVWQPLPTFIEINKNEDMHVNIIAAAVAAAATHSKEFKIKTVSKRNPEATLVALIATCLAKENGMTEDYHITSIKKRIQ